MRFWDWTRMIALVLLLGSALEAASAEARIKKVLPHLLDSQGRHTLSPSLYERDAYQALLRAQPKEVSALRYDIHWKTEGYKGPLRLRLEVRASKLPLRESRVFETEVQPRRFWSNWSAILLDRNTVEEIGTVIAWRASLWAGDKEIAEQRSFLW